ncbi:MAG: PAS domain-containing protein [bacterium]|nr:PAS domain-containing protein [bacterium]
MIKAERPADDEARIAELEAYQILDTPEESTYDVFTRLARAIAGTSASTISLVDRERQWFKSYLGLPTRETPRDVAFCDHVVASGMPLTVEDATKDERFSDNPLVLDDPNVRFYAGVPLQTPSGHTIGTLCVLDTAPKTITDEQLSSLKALAETLMSVLEGRRRMLGVFDAAHIDLFMVDPSDRTITFASRGACARLGYALRELVAMPIFDVVPNLSEGFFDALVERARGSDEVVREADLVRRDGSSYPVEVRIDVTRVGSDERVLIVAFDLTQRRLAQREINLLLGAINVAGDVIIVYEVGPMHELTVNYVNDAFTRQTGFSREEAVGRTLESFRHAMPDDDGMRRVRAAFASGEPTQAEVVSYRKDGSTFWNQVTLHPIRNVGGTVTHWISIERDITQEVARTSALAEEHDRLLSLTRAARRLFTALSGRALIGTFVDVIAQLLNADARVLAVREDGMTVALEDLGSVRWEQGSRDEVVERAVRQETRVVDETSGRILAYAGRFGEARYVLDVRMRAGFVPRKTDLFVFDLIAEYFSVAARNVTLYLELDERRLAVLELSQTKSDLIAMLAHDFRGPLTSIVGFADLTGEVGDVNEEQREFLDTIKRSALQLSELASDTLTLSRLERNEVALQVSDVNLASLVESVVAQYADRRRVRVVVSGDTRVSGDDDRLRQVFSNLVDNAIKYSPNGSEPEVTIEGRADDVVVRVRDHGIGIPPGELSRVFDRFSRASNAKRLNITGTGFGLFLTKQLVALHGGTIAVESVENQGTTFIVTLSRRVDRRAAPRTLAVLDPERDKSVLAYGLQEAGYRVVVIGSPNEVTTLGDAQPVDALVVIAPEELSRDQVAQFRTLSRERSFPVVAVGSEQTAARIGAAVTLPQPVLIGDLIAALDRLLTTR